MHTNFPTYLILVPMLAMCYLDVSTFQKVLLWIIVGYGIMRFAQVTLPYLGGYQARHALNEANDLLSVVPRKFEGVQGVPPLPEQYRQAILDPRRALKVAHMKLEHLLSQKYPKYDQINVFDQIHKVSSIAMVAGGFALLDYFLFSNGQGNVVGMVVAVHVFVLGAIVSLWSWRKTDALLKAGWDFYSKNGDQFAYEGIQSHLYLSEWIGE